MIRDSLKRGRVPHVSRNQKERILLHGSNLWYLSEGLFGPLFAVFAERVGGNILTISWAWALYLFISGTLIIVFGSLSDGKIAKEKLLVGGYALYALCAFAYVFVTSQLHLLLVQVGYGIAAAMTMPTWTALYAENGTKQRGHLWGLAGGEAQLITGFAMIMGGVIVNYWSFTLMFALMGGIHTLVTLHQLRLLRK